MVLNDAEWERMTPEERRQSDYYTVCLMIDKHLRELEKWTEEDIVETMNAFSDRKDWTLVKVAEALAELAVGPLGPTERLVYRVQDGHTIVSSENDAQRAAWELAKGKIDVPTSFWVSAAN